MSDPTSACTIIGFEPLAGPDARVLVLGSIPSERSLVEQQYYAHPQNAFWPIMERLFGGGVQYDYAGRVEMLKSAKVAVWDVLHAGVRPGSLDSAIVSGSEVANDIAGFLEAHPDVRVVFFNGAKAESLFRARVAPTLAGGPEPRFVRLPSTSPAHASLSREEKLERWTVVTEAVR